MSDTDKDQATENSETQSATTEDDTVEEKASREDDAVEEPASREDDAVEEIARAEEVEPPQLPAKRKANAIAWLALFLALISVAAVGYTISRDWLAARDSSTEDALANLELRLETEQEAREEVAARVAELDALDQAGSSEVDDLRRELDERVASLSALPTRMSTLESNVSSLAGISAGARDTWLLAEAEYYMQIANAQLQLANNPHLASLALGMADERVVQLGNPALTDVRRAIADELAALEVMEKPDIAGATLTLASLARVVESLPLQSRAEDEEQSPENIDEEQSGVSRAWSSVKGAMSGLVKVTPPDQAKLALVSPDAEYFLRNNIALQLQSARLALLRGEQAVFEQALDDTSALLSQYFDGDSAQVASAQETLSEIRSNVFTSSAPDISGSLRLLRQFRTLSETSR